MRRALGLFAFFLLSLLLVGCGDQAVPVRAPRPDKVYVKIVSLSPSASEVYMLGYDIRRLKGRTAACNYPQTVMQAPVVASLKPDYERIQGIAPDLVIYDGALFTSEADKAKLKQIGADEFVIDANTIDAFEKQVYELGAILQLESQFSGYVDKIEFERNSALGGSDRKIKAAVMMAGKGGEHWIAGVGSFVADVVRGSGGEPVGPEGELFTKLNVEYLVTQNPEMIFVPGKKGALEDVEAILKDPRLQSVQAVKRGAVAAIDPDILLRRGGRVDALIKAMRRAFGELRRSEAGAR